MADKHNHPKRILFLEDFVCQAIPDLNRTVVQPPKKRAVEADRRDETGNKTEIPEDGGESKPPLGNS